MTVRFSNPRKTRSTVFALHSSASNGNQWASLVENFDRDYDVYTPDLPGYSPIPAKVDYSQPGLAAVAAPVISQIESVGQPVHLIGHSFGGAVALNIALNRPELLKSLSVYEPACFHILKSGNREQRLCFEQINLISAVLSASVISDRPDLGMMRFVDFWNGEGSWACMPEKKRRILSQLATVVMSNFADGMGETWDIGDLASLSVPTLVMQGTDSPKVAQVTARTIADAIPGASSAIFRGLNHMAPAYQPDRIFPVIRDHISTAGISALEDAWSVRLAA